MCREWGFGFSLTDYLRSSIEIVFCLKPEHSCQWNAVKTLTTCKHRAFDITNVFTKTVYAFLRFLSNVYVLVIQHVSLPLRQTLWKKQKKMKLKSICKICLSIWHLGKHPSGEMIQDTLWHRKQPSEVSGSDTCLHKVQNIVRKCTTPHFLIKCPVSVIHHQSGGVSSSNVHSCLWQNQCVIQLKIPHEIFMLHDLMQFNSMLWTCYPRQDTVFP